VSLNKSYPGTGRCCRNVCPEDKLAATWDDQKQLLQWVQRIFTEYIAVFPGKEISVSLLCNTCCLIRYFFQFSFRCHLSLGVTGHCLISFFGIEEVIGY